MNKFAEVDIDHLAQMLTYDPESGLLTWRISRGRVRAGDVAGCADPKGYWRVGVDGTYYRRCRIAWALHYKFWPENQIDHINGVRSDDRICNLRDVAASINEQNKGGAIATNRSSGLMGVTWNSGKQNWKAQISVNGRNKHLGYFKDASAAHAVYLEAKKLLHPGFIGIRQKEVAHDQ